MNRFAFYLFCFLSVVCFVSCSGDPITPGGKDKIGAITGEVSHISCRNAEIAGRANLPGTTATDLTFGVLYSTNSGVLLGSAVQIQAKSFDSNYNFIVGTEVLEPETTYYYRSYFSQNGEITYGETKSFTTLPVSSMIKTDDVTDINPLDAILHASLDLTDCRYESIEYGFQLKEEGHSATTFKADNLSNKAFSVKVIDLECDANYEVAAYVTLDGRTYTADKKTFTTQTIQANILLNDATEITELKATISGRLNIESQGSFEECVATLCYSSSASTADELYQHGSFKDLTLSDIDRSFSTTLTGLAQGVTYYYCVEALVNRMKIFKSEVKSFTTAKISVTTTTNSATNVSYSSAQLNCEKTVSSIESLSSLGVGAGWFLYSETATTASALKESGTKVSIESPSVAGQSVSYSATLVGLKAKTTYYFVSCLVVGGITWTSAVKSFTTNEANIVAVDMGLSVKWASFNVGAGKPEDYGYYYAWGETTPKSNYDWSTYTLGNGYYSMTKYCTNSSYGTIDNKTILNPEDDVAHIILGEKWRIPTISEWVELRSTDNCTWAVATRNGVYGVRVTSKKTGNSIFLPAAGEWYGSSFSRADHFGDYWSSSLYYEQQNTAWEVYFDRDTYSLNGPGAYAHPYRHYGLSVRPVCD